MMNEEIGSLVETYRQGTISRRRFFDRLIALTGSMAAAHVVLESTGIAATLVSGRESEEAGVESTTVVYPAQWKPGVAGYLSLPKDGTDLTGVVVIHENRGLNDHIRDIARRLAAAGFAALAPDLLSRRGGTGSMASPDAARTAIGTVTQEEALSDLDAGLEYLGSHPRVAHGCASVGFCWGGARSFLLATHNKRLKAAVVFYGSAPDEEAMAGIQCPVLGLYGGTDERITSHVPDVAAWMKKLGKDYTYRIYDGAGHAFMNDQGERYNPEAAADAWQRMVDFLRTHIVPH